MSDYTHHHSHWLSNHSLSDWLKEENVPALYGIDTRALTKQLRSGGVTLATVTFDGDKESGTPLSQHRTWVACFF